MKILNKEDFIGRAREIHGDHYIYDEVDYKNSNVKVKIICPKHGPWQCRPSNHIGRKSGCLVCGRERQKVVKATKAAKGSKSYKKRINPELIGLSPRDLLSKLKDINREKFDYSDVLYIKGSLINIFCKKHNIYFDHYRYDHISGWNGCPECKKDYNQQKGSSVDEFIEKAKLIHGEKYDYRVVEYINTNTKVKIMCPEHGLFSQTPHTHIVCKSGCPRCALQLSEAEFTSKVFDKHGDRYDYSKTIYKGSTNEILIICKEHGEFHQKAAAHLSGNGCPKCNVSKGELRIRRFFQDNGIEFEEQKYYKDCVYTAPMPYDFYIPKLNLLIEYDGIQHFPEEYFKRFGKYQKTKRPDDHREFKDFLKDLYASDNNIRLLRIKYTERIKVILKGILEEYRRVC